jgi:hypothetical protein
MKRSALFVLGLCLVLGGAVSPRPNDYSDDVIDYYWDKAKLAFESGDPVAAGLVYDLVAATYYKHIGKNGKVVKIDSATSEYHCRAGQIDSQLVINGDGSRFADIDLNFTSIFGLDYHHFGFPNDTGGDALAIGLETDSSSTNPNGLLVIDRNSYLLQALYLFYPEKQGYKTFSRSFHFIEVDGYIFPDSIREVGSREGIFSTENYRVETSISSIVIRH